MDAVEILLLVIYTLYVLAPMVRDELVLRVVLLVASVGFVAWGWVVGERVTVVANIVFVILSLRHIARLLRQRQPVELTTEQEVVHNRLFSAMSRREFADLWQLGETFTAPAGDLIVRGDDVEDVIVVLDQPVIIVLDTGNLTSDAPSLLGEMSYALGETASATATVRVDVPVQIRRWTKATLRDLKRTHPDLEVPFLAALGSNLARKVRL